MLIFYNLMNKQNVTKIELIKIRIIKILFYKNKEKRYKKWSY